MASISSNLIKLDQALDYIPAVSTVSNIVNLFIKYVIYPNLPPTLQINRYFFYINEKEIPFILLIPGFGQLYVLRRQRNAEINQATENDGINLELNRIRAGDNTVNRYTIFASFFVGMQKRGYACGINSVSQFLQWCRSQPIGTEARAVCNLTFLQGFPLQELGAIRPLRSTNEPPIFKRVIDLINQLIIAKTKSCCFNGGEVEQDTIAFLDRITSEECEIDLSEDRQLNKIKNRIFESYGTLSAQFKTDDLEELTLFCTGRHAFLQQFDNNPKFIFESEGNDPIQLDSCRQEVLKTGRALIKEYTARTRAEINNIPWFDRLPF